MTKQNVHAEGVVAAYFTTGSQPLLRRYYCVQERGGQSQISKYRGFVVYSMIKTGGRRKMFKTRANAAT